MSNTVVILGGSYAGLGVAHKLLKLNADTPNNLRVVMISESTHFFWNLAVIRAIIPNKIPLDKILLPIAPGFAHYPKGSFEFIQGRATGVNTETKTVSFHEAADADTHAAGAESTLAYDHLVIATGARSSAAVDTHIMPWKAQGTHADITARIQHTTAQVEAANDIVVAGGGANGVELSAELAYAYPNKRVTLLVLDVSGVLTGDAIAPAVEKQLAAVGVVVRRGVRVHSATAVPNSTQTAVRVMCGLDDETITTDCYLPAMGLQPNSEFLDASMRNDRGYVEVDEFFTVGASGDRTVWAVGDVVSAPRASLLATNNQSPQVARNIHAAIKGVAGTAVKPMPFDAVVCSIGPKRGVGRMGKWRIPGFFLVMGKSRTLMVGNAKKYVDGSQF